jgi:hypothetical protein
MQPWYSEDAWLTVKTGDLSRLLRTLGLTDALGLPWSKWPSMRREARKKLKKVNSDGPGAGLRRLVFISPDLDGWRMLVGDRFYASSWEDVEESGTSSHFTQVAEWCCQLSRQFGEAHAFTADWENGTFAFILTRHGKVDRQFVDASGDLLIDEGEPTAEELVLRANFDPGPDDCPLWFSYEHPDNIAAIAAACSIHPSRLSRRVKSGVVAQWSDRNDQIQPSDSED